jgi:lipopolysaccharide/colanic/teichoic acid biosynthesis glycosyltransferase
VTPSSTPVRAAGASKRARPAPIAVRPRPKRASDVALVRSSGARAHHRRHVIEEALFRGSLVRERQRADRSNLPFLVLLLELDERARADSSRQRSAIDALLAVGRETDILGWLEHGAVLGVIIPGAGAADPAVAGGLEARVRNALAKRFDAKTVSGFSIRVHAHPWPMEVSEAGTRPVDALLPARGGRSRSRVYHALKRAFDIAGSSTLLLLLAPLLAAIAALVRCTSHGPVLFRQERVGEGARPFPMLKFRTMDVGAGHGIHKDYVTQFITAGAAVAGRSQVFKLTDDPRVTSVGRVLRKTSLDELPQLWNVLRGEMSLVGPRPPLAYEVEQYKPWHRRRVLEARPGITGLWQVKGRSRTTFDEMVRLDLRYARTRSLWMDLGILLATPRAVIAGRGAC